MALSCQDQAGSIHVKVLVKNIRANVYGIILSRSSKINVKILAKNIQLILITGENGQDNILTRSGKFRVKSLAKNIQLILSKCLWHYLVKIRQDQCQDSCPEYPANLGCYFGDVACKISASSDKNLAEIKQRKGLAKTPCQVLQESFKILTHAFSREIPSGANMTHLNKTYCRYNGTEVVC